MKREYYSQRKGIGPSETNLDLPSFKKLFLAIYRRFEREGYFQKYFGMYCVDRGDVPGELGEDVESAIFISLRKADLWPVTVKIDYYSEDDVFDMIEYLHDHCAKPTQREMHEWGGCGWHVSESDDKKGRIEFRDAVNDVLKDYKSGFEISEHGEILILPDDGMMQLIEAEIITDDTENIQSRINSAINKFRRARASEDDRRDALRDLADVLEYLRPQAKTLLVRQDESDLFNIANNFGIRHHNQQQKTDYDKATWQSWIFYSYLSTIHLLLRLIKQKQ